MPILVILAAVAVAASLPLLWWSVSSARPAGTAVVRNLTAGTAGSVHDLRALLLDRGATERAVQPFMATLAGRARRMTPQGMLDALERRITLAGRPAEWPMERVLAAKLILAAGGLLFGFLLLTGDLSTTRLLGGVAATAGGYFIPDLLLYSRAQERQKAIQSALPDTLDQMTISVEAGLGFEAALALAGKTGEGPLADEIVRTLQEMQVGASRKQAFRSLADRTDVADLRHFVVAVMQAEAYGIPVADVLRTQADEMRLKRRQRAEERAMKVPVKVIFPLILCIFPTLLIVLLGPAFLRIMDMFTHM
jgi:tight adherence protein C